MPGPFGKDEPAPIPFPPVPPYPRPSTPPVPPNLPTHLESPSPSPPLGPSKWPLVKIEEVKDNEDNDTEMFSLSPSPSPKAGPLQYIPPEFPPIIPHKWGNSPHVMNCLHRYLTSHHG